MSDAGWPRNERRIANDERVERLEKIILVGNGKPGLTTRMNDVEKDIKLIQEREDRKAKKQDRIELAVWAAVAIAVINLIFSHIH